MIDKLKQYFITLMIFMFATQSISITGILNPVKALAASENITHIAFTTGEQLIEKNSVSGIITSQTQNESNTSETVSGTTTLNLSSTSSTGLFSPNGTDDWVGPTRTLTMDSETANRNFYYKDSTADTYTLSVSAQDQTWTETTQSIIITDSTTPTSTVTYPESNGFYNNLEMISGTATDPDGAIDVEKVEIKAQRESDGKFFDGTDWIDGYVWLPAGGAYSTATDSGTFNWYYYLDNSFLSAGYYKLYHRATDYAGNREDYSSFCFYFDNQAPTGSILINNGADVTNGSDMQYAVTNTNGFYPYVFLDFTYSDDGFVTDGVKSEFSSQTFSHEDKMRVSNNVDFISDGLNESYREWGPINNHIEPWYLDSSDGQKYVYVQFMDKAGNLSPIYSDSIFYSGFSSPVNVNELSNQEESYNFLDGMSGFDNVEIWSNVSNPVSFFASSYSQNPAGQTSGINFLNQYYDFSSSNDSNLEFPLYIKIYYTDAELVAAGITEDQLQGLFFFDFNSNSWKLYSNTGVDKNNTGIYSGFVWAYADHLTPMSIGGDVTAPSKPSNLTATSGDGQISLNWDQVNDASQYKIRYRKSTSTDNTDYQYATISNSSTTVINLTNDTEYEFGVAAIDSAGNISDYAVVVQTPHKSSSTATTTSSSSKKYLIKTALAAESSSTSDSQQVTNPSNENIQTVNPEDGNVKASEENNNGTDWTRILVTLGIIVIAAGAGYGGYYGYLWWMGKEKKDDKNKKSSGKKGGRW